MNNIKINISKDPKFGYSNLSFSEKPTEEMLQEMKSNGWRYSSHFKHWYPGTEEARRNSEAFAQDYIKRFSPEVQEKTISTGESFLDLNAIENAVDAYISEKENEMQKGNYAAFIEVQNFVLKNNFITANVNGYIKRFVHSIEDIKGLNSLVAYGNNFYTYEQGEMLVSELNKKIKKYESIKNNPGQNDYNDLLEMIKTEIEMLDNSQNKGTLYSVLQREGDFYEKKLRRSNERSFEEERTDYSREAGSSFSNEMEEQRSIYNSNEISDPAGHRVSHTHAGRNNGIGSEYEAHGASADLQGQQYSGSSVGQEELSETGKINDSTRNADNGLQNLSEGRVEVHTDEPDVSTGEHGDGLIVLTEEAAAELVKNDNQKMNFVQEKLAAAGIEVVKDKAEFERILNNVEILQKMTEENSVEDLFVSSNDENLDSEIDKLTVNDIHLKNDFIEISKETPFILRQCGLDNYPVCMYKQKLARALFLEKEEFGERRTHGHKGEFTDKDVKEVFSNLGNPRYVFNSTKNNSIPDDFYVIGVYDQFDKNNNPMMVSFHFNKNTKEVEANWVTAVYGRNKIDIMKNWVEKGYLLYINDLEIEKASAEVGTLYMRVIHNANAYSKKIIRKSDFVNNLDMLFYKLHNQTYGFAHNGKIYLNPEIANSEVAIHEYTHLWDNYIQRTNSNLWEIGKNIFKNTHYWNDVKADPNYADIADNDDLLLSEVHAQLVGKMAEEVLNKIIERDGELTKDSIIDWDKECWLWLSNEIAGVELEESEVNQRFKDMTSFLSMTMKDFMSGKNISIPKEQSVTKEPVQLTSKKDIKAIREQCREILQKPDSEITEEDKTILAQYEGAGGIKENDRSASGILNEFYTPNNLVEKVWQLVDSYAPNAKTVLEPSAGVGKFANNRPNNEFTMHELDETSARINKILHPDANIIQGAYQKQFFDAGGRIHIPGQSKSCPGVFLHFDFVDSFKNNDYFIFMKFKVEKLPQAEAEINDLEESQQEMLNAEYRMIENQGIEFVRVKPIQKDIFEIKSNELRSLFKYTAGKIIVIGVVFVKKTKKTPKDKIKLAKKRLKEV